MWTFRSNVVKRDNQLCQRKTNIRNVCVQGAVSPIFSITVTSQKTHFYLWKPKNKWSSSIKMGIPVHENYKKYVWIGMARIEMASDLKTSGRIFQVSVKPTVLHLLRRRELS